MRKPSLSVFAFAVSDIVIQVSGMPPDLPSFMPSSAEFHARDPPGFSAAISRKSRPRFY